jgi:hypothetical protein
MASPTGVLVGAALAGVVVAGVAGVSLTSVAKNVLLGSDSTATVKDVNTPRYADE